MKIKDVLAKISKGEELTAEEKKFVEEYEDQEGGSGENRIPKSRLDTEISKRKKAEEDLQTLKDELDELKDKLDELESSGMSEAEKSKKESEKAQKKLQDQIDALTKERDEAVSKMTAYERSGKVRSIADKHSFSDADYLDYLLNSKQIDLEKESDVSNFLRDLSSNRPELFKSSAKPGSGTGGAGGGQGDSAAKKEFDELMKKKELSTAEASRVIELQDKIKAEEGSENNKGE